MRKVWPVILGGVAVFLLVAAFAGSDRGLRRSAIGLEGLRHWLHAEGVRVRDFSGGYPIRRDGIGLRLRPIQDGDLNRRMSAENPAEDPMSASTAFDLDADTLVAKAEAIQTLFILPKWQGEVRHAGAFHNDFLRSENEVSRVADRLILDEVAISQARVGFVELPHDGKTAVIYGPQTLRAPTCTPIIGSRDAMVLARCFLVSRRAGGVSAEALVLADPDLLNTHGLRLGENAVIARTVLTELAAGGDILIDRSTGLWTLPEERPVVRERTWADLARFFDAPFRLLWVLLAIGTVLVLWRAWLRFGAARPFAEDGPPAARAASVGAEVRLLRAAGDRRALVRSYVEARLRRFSAILFPSHVAFGEAQMWRVLRATSPDRTRVLEMRVEGLRALPVDTNILALLEEFESDLKRVKDAVERST